MMKKLNLSVSLALAAMVSTTTALACQSGFTQVDVRADRCTGNVRSASAELCAFPQLGTIHQDGNVLVDAQGVLQGRIEWTSFDPIWAGYNPKGCIFYASAGGEFPAPQLLSAAESVKGLLESGLPDSQVLEEMGSVGSGHETIIISYKTVTVEEEPAAETEPTEPAAVCNSGHGHSGGHGHNSQWVTIAHKDVLN